MTQAIRTRAIPLLGISLGYFLVLLDTTVLAVAEPDLAASLGASVAGLQWVTTGYTVAFAALLLSAGAVTDRFGASRVFRAGVVAFCALSLTSAVAPNLGALIGIRVLLGAAAAACVPSSLALLSELYPERPAHARAIGVWAAISGAAIAAGPLIGGALVAWHGWRAVFLVNVPIGVLVVATTSALRSPRGAARVNWLAQAAVAAALALTTDALVAAGRRAWLHAACAVVASLAAAGVFTAVNRETRLPVLDPRVVGDRRVRAALLAGGVVNFALAGVLFVLPLVLAHRGFGPLATGLGLAPLTVPFVVNPPFTARLVAARGHRTAILLGLALLTVGTAALAVTDRYLAMVPGLLLAGLGVSFVLPALVGAVLAAAPPGSAGSAGGVLNTSRQTGAVLGVAVLGGAYTASGATPALLVAAAAAAAAGVRYAVVTRERNRRRRDGRRTGACPPA
ncbi:MFS transporter [Cryptosporangium sp. NPDC048952]|uniref:MFS transporter n=1 Tax=Cryptosporangium sp. NPDC048952 TaxID=3363961 RepID=UPI0037173A88